MSTWIFLRGLTRESRHWGNFPETFRSEVPAAQVFSAGSARQRNPQR